MVELIRNNNESDWLKKAATADSTEKRRFCNWHYWRPSREHISIHYTVSSIVLLLLCRMGQWVLRFSIPKATPLSSRLFGLIAVWHLKQLLKMHLIASLLAFR